MMKKLLLTPFLVLLFACGSVGLPQEAKSTVNITAPIGGYEEGTWTPSVGGTATYAGQFGSYIKIGRFVRASARLVISAIGTGNTSVISGLPFTSAGAAGAPTMCGVRWANLSLAVTYMVGFVDINSTQIAMVSATVAALTLTNQAVFGNSTDVYVTCTYYTQ